MKTVTLGGVFGTRVVEKILFIPKLLVEIATRLILWYNSNIYSLYGINDQSMQGNNFIKKLNLLPLKLYIEFLKEINFINLLYNTEKYNNIIYNPISYIQRLNLNNVIIFGGSYVKKTA